MNRAEINKMQSGELRALIASLAAELETVKREARRREQTFRSTLHAMELEAALLQKANVRALREKEELAYKLHMRDAERLTLKAESEENCAIMAVEEIMDFIEHGNILNSVNYPTVQAGKWDAGSRVVVLHKNIPSMLGTQTGALAKMGVNISNMMNKSLGDFSCTLLDCDEVVDEEIVRKAFTVDGIISVRVV